MTKFPVRQSLIAAAAALTLAGSVLAVGPSAKAEDAVTSAQEHKAANALASDVRQVNAQTHLEAAKLKACQKRESAINGIMSRIADRGQKQLDVFNKIADRTETFYTSKGHTLANYDALVADVNAKKTAAETATQAVKSDSVSFKCDGTDPKGAAVSFKASLKSEIAALKAYKTAVKNLIVGVKSVQGTSVSATSKTQGGEQ